MPGHFQRKGKGDVRHILLFVLVVALLASLAAPAVAQSEAVAGEPVAAMLSIQGAGLAIFDAFPAGMEPRMVGIVSLKALPVAPPDAWTLGTTPQKLAADATLDILTTTNDIDLGIGVPAATVDAAVPVRIGIGRVDAWGWYLKTDFMQGQDQDRALNLTATYDGRAGIGAALMCRWQF